MNRNHGGNLIPPRGLTDLIGILLPAAHRDEVLGDLDEQYADLADSRGRWMANLWLTVQLLLNLAASIRYHVFWTAVYFGDELRLGWRHIRRNRIHTLTNVIGLLVGLTCSLMIILYAVNELSYDRYHPDSERIYRINDRVKYRDREYLRAFTPPVLAPRIRENYPQAELVAQVEAPWENSDHVLVYVDDQTYFDDRTWFTEPELLDLFDMPLLRGDRASALRAPHTMLLSRSWAEKLFGSLDEAVGKSVTVEIDYESVALQEDFLVTGVVEDSRVDTHLKGDLWLSHSTLEQNVPWLYSRWQWHRQRFTYVRLTEGADSEAFEASLRTILEEFDAASPLEGDPPKERYSQLEIQPVTGIHLGEASLLSAEPVGNMTYIYVYAAVALLVLLVACLNFVHLASTISLRRAHEFSVRRTFGALRGHLSMQMLAESFLVTMLALLGSITLVQLMLPLFNSFTGRALTLAGLLHPAVLVVMFLLVMLVILGAGVIPAVVHTLARPVDLLHSSVGASKKNRMPGQKVFILAQLTILSFLLICTFVVQHQLTFMKGQALGFEREQRVILNIKSDLPGFHRRYEAIGEAFRSIPGVLNASVSSSVPGEQWGGYNLTRTDLADPEPVFGRVFTVDPYFSEVYGLQCREGRVFTPEDSGEENYGYVINETLMKDLGFVSPQDALGKQLHAHYHGLTKPIIGVIRDFHFFGMQQEINPMLLDIEPSLMSRITLTIPVDDVQNSLRAVGLEWEQQFPGIPFEYRFLDEVFDAQYRYEEQAGRLLAIVTVVTILIALMGLIGLVMSVVQQRRSEIGIRKVLGATQLDIVRMLTGNMMAYALISSVISIPIAWWAMHQWLGNFAYRVAQTPWLPLSAVGVILLLTVGMLSIQGWRTSRINPATVIREE